MRMRLRRDDEDGAVAVIVVISIVAVFAMVVLTIDVGNLLFERRRMVNAADAAALAAAQTCADSADTQDPRDVADEYAQDNVPDAARLSYADEGCKTSSGRVTVSYAESENLFFAPVIGGGDTGTITTEATAEWLAGGATNPVPFVISADAFQSGNCDVPNVPVNTVCHFWEDNGGGGAGGFGGSSFGYIDVNPDSFNVDPGTCPNNNNKGSLQDYAEAGGYDGRNGVLPELNYPEPTWACGSNGLVDGTFEVFAENEGEILAFPVVDTTVVTQGSFVQAWNVIGFVKMELVDVIRAKDGASGGSSGSCSASIPQTQATAASEPHTLSLFAAEGCPNSTSALDAVTNLELRGCGNGPGSACTLGTDYTVIPSTGVTQQVKFSRSMSNSIEVQFDWEYYGVCGPPATDNSGYCFLLKWKGVQLGNVAGGQNFGLVRVRLCDESLADSCRST
jgi:Flp pilus assembly protein TadG